MSRAVRKLILNLVGGVFIVIGLKALGIEAPDSIGDYARIAVGLLAFNFATIAWDEADRG